MADSQDYNGIGHMPNQADFQEIAHCGGQIIIRVGSDKNGKRGYQLTWHHQRPVAAALFAVYAIPQGVAVCQIFLGGVGTPWNPAPIPGCYPVFIGSDSEGKFGHECPACSGYWRSRTGAAFCPYCRTSAEVHELLTSAQRGYVELYCSRMREILHADVDGEYVIDMDAVADAVGKDNPKPPFYYAEQSQQNKFTCSACGEFNDILGIYGYCSACGTRNDLQELQEKTIPLIRNQINAGGSCENSVRDSVAAFDSFVGKYVEQLIRHVPLSSRRRNLVENKTFQNLKDVASNLKEVFDIDILDGLSAEEVEFAKLMFHRRHVYEHKGGEADEKYIKDSGDTTIRPKQAIQETVESAHRIAGLVLKMASNLHREFHEILPVHDARIQRYKRSQSAAG